MTNGAHYMAGSSAGVTGKPFAHLITLPAIKRPIQSEPLTFAVPLNISKASKSISAVVQNSATGNWLIAGDFGLRIHN